MSKMKQRLWLVSMLLVYVAIAVAGFTIAYIIKKDFTSQDSSNAQPTSEAKITSTPPPSGWKTYTDTNDQLQFSYPAADTMQTKSYGFGVSSVTLANRNGTDFQILLIPKSLAQAIGQDFDSYYAMSDNTTKTIKNPVAQDNSTEKFTKIKNTTVDRNHAVDYQSSASNAKPGTPPEIGTFIEAGNNLVLISTGQSNKNTLEKIVQTFRYPL